MRNELGCGLLCVLALVIVAGCAEPYVTVGVPTQEVVAYAPEVVTYAPQVAARDKPVLMDFYSQSCPPCKELAPVFDSLAREYRGRADFVKIDTGARPGLSDMHRIDKTPTVLMLVGGREVRRWVGEVRAEPYRLALNDELMGR